MKIMHLFAAVVLLASLIAFAPTAFADERIVDWSSEQISDAFDEVARNYGAVEYAVYTFMVEFGRAPDSLGELLETRHLNVLMLNPYTSGEVKSLSPEDYPDGDLAGNILVTNNLNEGREVRIEAWFLRVEDGDTVMIRSMVKRITLYQSEIDYNYFFDNDLPRDEQLVAIYCRQAIDAIESFMQRNPESPLDFFDMYENGDVNVQYYNPMTDICAVSRDDLSPGDFFYEKIGEDGYTLIGWGREAPVFFATTDEEVEKAFYARWGDELSDGAEEEEQVYF